VDGSVVGHFEAAPNAASFYPKGLRLFALERCVPLWSSHRFYGCVECDLIWSKGPPHHLKTLVEASGSAKLLKALKLGSDQVVN